MQASLPPSFALQNPPTSYGVIAPGNHLLKDPLRSATPSSEGGLEKLPPEGGSFIVSY